MLFNSGVFIFIFLPIVLVGYYLLRSARLYSLIYPWLVGASLFFYGWWEPKYLILLVASIGINFLLGRWISRTEGHRKRAVLAIGVCLNLTSIGVFKYAGFAAESFNAITGLHTPVIHLLLPLGISFFTFQQITYLLDTYRGATRNEPFLHYALFVSFFPQLIAGPIVHHGEMLPQFDRLQRRRIRPERIAAGVSIFIVGLFKKAVIADTVAHYANLAFERAEHPEGIDILTAWMGSLSYTFQLYFDFSGYSDMAIGLGLLFGIRLPVNFNSPYKAKSIVEFWTRWHISLSRFLRDSLYIPLGGNRVSVPRWMANLFITMLLAGLWHGAGWTFVVWGAWHGGFVVVTHLWRKYGRGGRAPASQPVRDFVAWAATFFLVVLGWVLFRAESFAVAHTMLIAMFGAGATIGLPPNMSNLADTFALQAFVDLNGTAIINDYDFIFIWAALPLLLLWCRFAPNTQQFFRAYQPFIEQPGYPQPPLPYRRLRWRPTFLWGAVMAFLLFLALRTLVVERQTEFLYFNF